MTVFFSLFIEYGDTSLTKLDMQKLSPRMQAALEKHRKSLPSIYGPLGPTTGWDYGDDIKDYEEKERDSWNKFMHNSPIYRGYL